MQSKLTAVFAIALALCAFAPGAASAQGRGDVFVVAGVHVDETAQNAAAAQQAGFAAAQRLAFDRLVRRLTLPEELARTGVPAVDATAMERLVLSVQVEDEGRSGTRYIGRLSVRFDPGGVRTLLRTNNLTVVETRTTPVLVVAASGGNVPPETAALWREVFDQGGYGNELAPLIVAPESLQGPPAWDAAAPHARTAGAAAALYATLRVQGSTLTAQIVEVTQSGRRDLGEVTARASGEDPAVLRAGLASLADQVSARVQNPWRMQVVANAGQQGRIAASALYANQQQWERIKQALEGAAQTMISQIRIEAVGREGALVSFSFTGEPQQLAEELERRGVRLAQGVNGWELRTAGR